MQKYVWTKLLSPEEWHRVRLELVENGFSVPYEWGVVNNPKTGYRVVSVYERPVLGFSIGRITLTVTSPYTNVLPDSVFQLLAKLFDVK